MRGARPVTLCNWRKKEKNNNNNNRVAAKQDIIKFPGRKDLEQFQHSIPIAIGKISKFRIIGYVSVNDDTSIFKVWKTICNDASMSSELVNVNPPVKEWWLCKLDDEPICLLTSAVKEAAETKKTKGRKFRNSRSRIHGSSKAKDAGEIKKEEGLPDKDGMTSIFHG